MLLDVVVLHLLRCSLCACDIVVWSLCQPFACAQRTAFARSQCLHRDNFTSDVRWSACGELEPLKMCTSLFLWDHHPTLLFLLAFNRDEFLARYTDYKQCLRLLSHKLTQLDWLQKDRTSSFLAGLAKPIGGSR